MSDLEKTKTLLNDLGISYHVIPTADFISLDLVGGAKLDDCHGGLATTFFFTPSGVFKKATMYEI